MVHFADSGQSNRPRSASWNPSQAIQVPSKQGEVAVAHTATILAHFPTAPTVGFRINFLHYRFVVSDSLFLSGLRDTDNRCTFRASPKIRPPPSVVSNVGRQSASQSSNRRHRRQTVCFQAVPAAGAEVRKGTKDAAGRSDALATRRRWARASDFGAAPEERRRQARKTPLKTTLQ